MEGFHTRCHDFVSAFIPRIERHPTLKRHKNIMLVSHAATTIALVKSLVGNRKLPLRVGTCTLSTLARVGKEGIQWEGKVLGRGDFLPNGVERDWGFEDSVFGGDDWIFSRGVPGTSKSY
jgi:transcription factor C subunit 7